MFLECSVHPSFFVPELESLHVTGAMNFSTGMLMNEAYRAGVYKTRALLDGGIHGTLGCVFPPCM